MTLRCFVFFLFCYICSALHCCEKTHQVFLSSEPETEWCQEFNSLMSEAESRLVQGNFIDAWNHLERAETLLSFYGDMTGEQDLHLSFDKAFVATCLDSESEFSRSLFADFSKKLSAKACFSSHKKPQQNLFDESGHWPIVGPSSIPIKDCLENVDGTEKAFLLFFSGVKLPAMTRIRVEAAIMALADQAKRCCTQDGFWKSCLQPIVDAWKRTQLFDLFPWEAY